ncbi:MAG: hypothetical protein J7K31_03295 [Candidatus Aenigmarchaeota archaeon]|nr:hypothetical protein [Candidatus Aenigmarchaeota archaeon]
MKMVKTRCEVFSRVVGYLRPVNQWNDGKQAEFADRKTFDKQLRDAIQEQSTAN